MATMKVSAQSLRTLNGPFCICFSEFEPAQVIIKQLIAIIRKLQYFGFFLLQFK
jgi:hypothetical protein